MPHSDSIATSGCTAPVHPWTHHHAHNRTASVRSQDTHAPIAANGNVKLLWELASHRDDGVAPANKGIAPGDVVKTIESRTITSLPPGPASSAALWLLNPAPGTKPPSPRYPRLRTASPPQTAPSCGASACACGPYTSAARLAPICALRPLLLALSLAYTPIRTQCLHAAGPRHSQPPPASINGRGYGVVVVEPPRAAKHEMVAPRHSMYLLNLLIIFCFNPTSLSPPGIEAFSMWPYQGDLEHYVHILCESAGVETLRGAPRHWRGVCKPLLGFSFPDEVNRLGVSLVHDYLESLGYWVHPLPE
ncbi:hypothetical protein BD779DRAFT_1472637 [Infundibulicybe gibba]|nr:hypothetical protein BD779DRAFT_1472637 [Infundibulicybe gibba]